MSGPGLRKLFETSVGVNPKCLMYSCVSSVSGQPNSAWLDQTLLVKEIGNRQSDLQHFKDKVQYLLIHAFS